MRTLIVEVRAYGALVLLDWALRLDTMLVTRTVKGLSKPKPDRGGS